MSARGREGAYAGRRVLVLGAGGFIGRWVSRALTAAGAELVLGIRDRASAKDIFAAWGVRGTPVEVDLRPDGAAARVVGAYAPMVTFNLAGYGVDRTERDAALARRINADVPAELAAAVSELPRVSWEGHRLVHVGSALEYGLTNGYLMEGVTPNPTTDYGRTKLAGTRAIGAAAAAGLAAMTARLFTVYGPGEHPGRLLPTLLDARGRAGPIALTRGDQRRDFTWVGDVAEGLVRLGHSGPGPEVVNLATGTLFSVRAFVQEAARILRLPDDRLEFGAQPTRPDEMPHIMVATDRLRAQIGWVPETSITRGIEQTVAFGVSTAENP